MPPYVQKNWFNDPAGGTPIQAVDINKWEAGIKANDTHALGNGSDHGIRYGVSPIVGTNLCTIDWSLGTLIYVFAKSEPVTLVLANLPVDDSWHLILEVTDDGSDHAVFCPDDWKREGGNPIYTTSGGLDIYTIRGYGNVASDVRISQTLNWKPFQLA